MPIIKKANNVFSSIIQLMRVKGTDKLRRNRYVLPLDINAGLLLWNTLSLELLFLPNKNSTQWLSNTLIDDCKEDLFAHYFYVNEEFDEDVVLESIIGHLKKHTNSFDTKFTILPTTTCNARCEYCFEKRAEVKRIKMTDQIAKDVADFIVRTNKADRFRIDWFGGEPLLNVRAIDIISSELTERKMNYISSITTNGLLFDSNITKKALDVWKMKDLQITLDGTEKKYNAIKNYKGVDFNPYERVINNIDGLLNTSLTVWIRLNLSNDNFNDLLSLVDELKRRYKDKRNLHIYADLIDDERFTEDLFRQDNNLIQWSKLSERLMEYDDHTLNNSWPLHRCMADNDNTHTIGPDGKLYKCEHIHENESYGNIYDGITSTALFDKYKERYINEKCKLCPLNPVCIWLINCENDRECNYLTQQVFLTGRKRAMLMEFRKWTKSNTK